jgi:hypothetical protein
MCPQIVAFPTNLGMIVTPYSYNHVYTFITAAP